MSTPRVYRTDHEIVDLTQGAAPTEPARTPEQQKDFELGQAEARSKLGSAPDAEHMAKLKLAQAGKARGSITSGPGITTRSKSNGAN